jgi:hypothetical protein
MYLHLHKTDLISKAKRCRQRMFSFSKLDALSFSFKNVVIVNIAEDLGGNAAQKPIKLKIQNITTGPFVKVNHDGL